MNLLITSAGRRSYLVNYFKTALMGKGKVVVANSKPNAPASLVADQSYLVPNSWDSSYIEEILTICHRHAIRLVLSLHDIDAFILSNYHEVFQAEKIRLLVPPKPIAEACFDKYKFFQLASRYEIRHCHTYLHPKDIQDRVKAGKLSYPLILKPRWGFGSLGLFQADKSDELITLYNALKLIIRKSFLPHLAIYNDHQSIVIQGKLSGAEFGLNIVTDFNARFKTCLILKKHEMRSGETFAATTIFNQKLFEIGKSITKMILHHGIADADVMQHNGQHYLLEINPRFGGNYPFVHEAGANIPSAIIAWAEGRDPEDKWFSYQDNMRLHKDFNLRRL